MRIKLRRTNTTYYRREEDCVLVESYEEGTLIVDMRQVLKMKQTYRQFVRLFTTKDSEVEIFLKNPTAASGLIFEGEKILKTREFFNKELGRV